MNEFETIIDFGSENLRIGVFDNKKQCIYSSSIKTSEISKKNSSDQLLNKLIRGAETQLSKHLDNINVLYDSSKFYSIDLSIKKTFDQPTLINDHYLSLIDEANFIISENNFKDQIIHIIVNNIIVDENKKLEIYSGDIKIKSFILEIKFICLNKELISHISNIFKKNNLNISNIYCSSYVKSHFYKNNIEIKNHLIFLDIGFDRTSALIFYNNKLEFFNTIPIGGNSITKDISKVLKLDIGYSEDLKVKFNKDEKEISFNKNFSESINPYSELIEKNISVDLLKKIIEARIDEIIELTLNQNNFHQKINILNRSSIIFIGGGSKLLSNSYNLDVKKKISDLIFFEENDFMICESGYIYNTSEESRLTLKKKRSKRVGFFEHFFNLFSK